MRITSTMISEAAGQALQRLRERLARVQEQVATGQVVARASDDPYRATATMDWEALQRRAERAGAAASEASDWLGAAENGMNRLLNALQQSRELGVSARKVLPADARVAIATELERMRDEALTAANTQYRGIYLFSGNKVHTPAFSATGSGATYDGDGGNAQLEVIPGVRVALRVPGSRLAAGGDFVAVLGGLASAVRSGDDAGVAAHLTALDQVLAAVTAERSDVGVRMRTIEGYEQVALDTQMQISEKLASANGTDLAKAAMELAQEEMTYQAALAAAARSLPPSLMELLK